MVSGGRSRGARRALDRANWCGACLTPLCLAEEDPGDALTRVENLMDDFAMQTESVQTFVIAELLPAAVKALLGRGEEWDEEFFEQYNVFLQKYLSFCKNVALDHDLVATVETLSQIFDEKSKVGGNSQSFV